MIRQISAIAEEPNLEKVLWNVIKNKELSGTRFIRQCSVGKYNVDFYCPELKLAIELDAESYNESSKYDTERERFLLSKGIRILRLKNEELKKALTEFISSIVKR